MRNATRVETLLQCTDGTPGMMDRQFPKSALLVVSWQDGAFRLWGSLPHGSQVKQLLNNIPCRCASRKTLAVSKEEMQRREVEWQKMQDGKRPSKRT